MNKGYSILKYNLELTVFICGAVGMVLELVGARVLSPYAGSSLSTWTALIGVILGSLSLGYFLGGKIADKHQNYSVLAFIVLIAGSLIGFSALFKNSFLELLSSGFHLEIRIFSVISSFILFGLPSIALGIISPYAARLKIKQVSSSGATVGNLYAISTFGSILGTFLGGFFLIPAMGNSKLVYLLALILVITSLVISFRKMVFWSAAITAVLLVGYLANQHQPNSNVIVDQDSQFQRIQILSGTINSSNRKIYLLKTDTYGLQSAVFADGSPDLVFDYTKFYRLSEVVNPKIKSALMIGGAAYSFPRDYLSKLPEATIDVVEIDPKMTEIAKKYLFLKDDPRLSIFHEDGRVNLNQNQNKYDVVYLDAFLSLSPPAQLTTVEAVKKIGQSLTDNGFVMTNVISALEGTKSKFLWSEYATLKQIFPYVSVYKINTNIINSESQNLMLVGFKNQQEYQLALSSDIYKGNLYQGLTEKAKIFTDDYAPVEYLMDRASFR